MKIRSAVPENDCLIFLVDGKKQKNGKNICKTYTHPPPTGRRLRQKATNLTTVAYILQVKWTQWIWWTQEHIICASVHIVCASEYLCKNGCWLFTALDANCSNMVKGMTSNLRSMFSGTVRTWHLTKFLNRGCHVTPYNHLADICTLWAPSSYANIWENKVDFLSVIQRII